MVRLQATAKKNEKKKRKKKREKKKKKHAGDGCVSSQLALSCLLARTVCSDSGVLLV
jgi:hypothetical protein